MKKTITIILICILTISLVTAIKEPTEASEKSQQQPQQPSFTKFAFKIAKQYGGPVVMEALSEKTDEDTMRLVNFAISPTQAAISEAKTSYLTKNPENEESWNMMEQGIDFVQNPESAAMNFVVGELAKSDPELGKNLQMGLQIKGYLSQLKEGLAYIGSIDGLAYTKESIVTNHGSSFIFSEIDNDQITTTGLFKIRHTDERVEFYPLATTALTIKNLATYSAKENSFYIFDENAEPVEIYIISPALQNINLPNFNLNQVSENTEIYWKPNTLEIINNPAAITTTLNEKPITFIGDGTITQEDKTKTITASNLEYDDINILSPEATSTEPEKGLLLKKSEKIQFENFPKIKQIQNNPLYITPEQEQTLYQNKIYLNPQTIEALGIFEIQDYLISFSKDTNAVITPSLKTINLNDIYSFEQVEIPTYISQNNKLYTPVKIISEKSLTIKDQDSTITFIKEPSSFIDEYVRS